MILGNEDELHSLFPDADSLDTRLARLPELAGEAAITLGAKGSIAVTAHDKVRVDADQTIKVVDTTGAGDLYAAGYLFGRQRQDSLERSAEIATIAATEIISHIGARPQDDLSAKLG